MEEHGRVLAHRVQQHRPFEFGGRFPQDVDALGFQRAELVDQESAHPPATVSWPFSSRRWTRIRPNLFDPGVVYVSGHG